MRTIAILARRLALSSVVPMNEALKAVVVAESVVGVAVLLVKAAQAWANVN